MKSDSHLLPLLNTHLGGVCQKLIQTPAGVGYPEKAQLSPSLNPGPIQGLSKQHLQSHLSSLGLTRRPSEFLENTCALCLDT